jgi:hypothetical protein
MVRHSRLVELILSYVRRGILWLAAVLILPSVVVSVSEPQVLNKILVHILMPIAVLAAFIVIHVKQQIVVDHSRLLPTRMPQLWVAWAGLLVLGLALPLSFVAAFGQPWIVTAAAFVGILAPILWYAHTQSMILFVILFPAWLLLFSPLGFRAWQALRDGEWPAVVVCLLVGGVIGLVMLAWRMATMTEENREFHRVPHSGRWDHMARMTGQHPEVWRAYARGPLASWFEPSRRMLEKVTARPPRTLWDRVQRRRIGVTFGGWAAVIWIVFVWAVAASVPWYQGNHAARSALLTWLMIIPPAMAIQRVRGAHQLLGVEMMKPASRAACLTELGLALMVELMRMWLIIAVVFVVTWMIWERTVFLSASSWLTVAATGAAQVTMGAIGLWLLRYRAVLAPVLAFLLMAGAFCGGAAGLWEMREQVQPVAIGGIIAALLLIGVVIARDAHRRWMRTDIA